MDYRNVLTTCIYCGAGCNFYLQVANDRVVGVLPAKHHPISQGKLCIKGWNAHAFVHHEDRLTHPLIRENGSFREASWDEALALIAGKMQAAKVDHGPDSVGFMASAKCTNEENYLLQKFGRSLIGTNNIDHCARL
jgi:predicted molibdopterin-dependent oxidoreductase YjgC